MQNSIRMTIGIVNYNTREALSRCLQSIVSDSQEVVVVDNESTDGSVEMVRQQFPNVRVVESRCNRGFGAGVNQLLTCTSSEYLFVLNSDTVLQPGAVQALTAYLDQNPRAALVGPRLAMTDGSLQRSCRHFPGTSSWILDNQLIGDALGLLKISSDRLLTAWDHDCARVVPWVLGAAFAVRTAPVRAIGGFDESYFLYCEEIDLCWRLQAAGWQVHFAPVTTIIHFGGLSTATRSSEMPRYLSESTRRLYRKHAGGFGLPRLMFYLRSLVLSGRARLLSRA